jgi:flavodoxin
MKKTLVVYHSRSGITRRVAQSLARKLDGDLEEVKVVQPMQGAIGYGFCALEAIAGLTPALRPARKDPAQYALVVIGTPIWFWSLSSPIRSWLARHPRPNANTAFFCTMGGSGARRVFSTMARLAGVKPAATLALTDDEVDAGAEVRLNAFVRELKSRHARRVTRSISCGYAEHAHA